MNRVEGKHLAQVERNTSIKKQLIATGAFFCVFVVIAALWKLGVFNAAAKSMVDHSLNTMKNETERQQNQPKIMLLKDGTRIECRKVLDLNTHWGMVLKDGRSSSVKKEEVQKIIDGN